MKESHMMVSIRPLTGMLALVFILNTIAMPAQAQNETATPDALLPGAFLGLRQALDIALQKHPIVQEASATMKAASARTEQTKSLYYPQVYANVDSSAGAGRINPRFLIGGGLVQPNLSAYTAGVIANQRLYDFGFTRNLVESSKMAERAQEQAVQAGRAIVAFNVQRSYYTSLKRKRLVDIAEQTVRERGVIKSQIEALHRQQLKSKLDLDLVHVELTNAQSLLVKAKNDLKAGYTDLNRVMGIVGSTDYVLEELPVDVRPQRTLETLITETLGHPEVRRARELIGAAEARVRAMKRQYLPTISALASGGDYQTFDSSRNVPTGGWWAAAAMVSMPLFTGYMIENQVREAAAQQSAAQAGSLDIEQALTQQVTTSYLDTITLAQQIKLGEEQVRTSQEALQLAKQRYRLGLGSVVEVTQAEVAVTGAQTRLAEAQYDYKIAEVTLAYAAGMTGLSEAGRTDANGGH
jgi:outer membrane protein